MMIASNVVIRSSLMARALGENFLRRGEVAERGEKLAKSTICMVVSVISRSRASALPFQYAASQERRARDVGDSGIDISEIAR
jgi:hypothetical protein